MSTEHPVDLAGIARAVGRTVGRSDEEAEADAEAVAADLEAAGIARRRPDGRLDAGPNAGRDDDEPDPDEAA